MPSTQVNVFSQQLPEARRLFAVSGCAGPYEVCEFSVAPQFGVRRPKRFLFPEINVIRKYVGSAQDCQWGVMFQPVGHADWVILIAPQARVFFIFFHCQSTRSKHSSHRCCDESTCLRNEGARSMSSSLRRRLRKMSCGAMSAQWRRWKMLIVQW